jgi:hypothetical protein
VIDPAVVLLIGDRQRQDLLLAQVGKALHVGLCPFLSGGCFGKLPPQAQARTMGNNSAATAQRLIKMTGIL